MATIEEECEASYNEHFRTSAYSSWEYAQVIQKSVLCRGEDWKIFLETRRNEREKWSRRRKNNLRRKIDAIPEDELRKILLQKNGDCTRFAMAVVNNIPSDSFAYMGDGEHTLAYSKIGNEILIIDSMYKEIIKFSDDNSPIWVKDRKINIKNPARNEQGEQEEQEKYYPEKDEGLIVKGIDNPSTVVVWRVKKVNGKVDCLHENNCAHKPFVRLSSWQEAIRQSLFLWTIKGQCVILFRTHVEEGPGFDGQIDFRAGEKSIILSQREFKGGKRYHKKVIFEFEKGKEEEKEKDELRKAFLVTVDDFLKAPSHTNRRQQFESTRLIFEKMVLTMTDFWGPPRFKRNTESLC